MDGAPTAEVRQALAPTGKLRVGVYPGSPFSMIRDAASGETKGLTVEVGKALAARLGVAYEAVEFQRAAEILAALKAGKIDVSLSNATPARAQEYGWTPPLLLIELGYLVLPGSPVTSFADVDRARHPRRRDARRHFAQHADARIEERHRRAGADAQERDRNAVAAQGRRVCDQQGEPVRDVR